MVDWQIDANRPRRVTRSSLTWVLCILVVRVSREILPVGYLKGRCKSESSLMTCVAELHGLVIRMPSSILSHIGRRQVGGWTCQSHGNVGIVSEKLQTFRSKERAQREFVVNDWGGSGQDCILLSKSKFSWQRKMHHSSCQLLIGRLKHDVIYSLLSTRVATSQYLGQQFSCLHSFFNFVPGPGARILLNQFKCSHTSDFCIMHENTSLEFKILTQSQRL